MGIREDLQKAFQYLDANDFDRATKIANRALKIDPHNPTSQLILGNAALKANRLSVAQKHFEKGLAVASAFDMRGSLLNNLAAVHMLKLQYAKAAECFEQAARCKPADRDIQANVAYAYYMSEDYDRARELYEALLPQAKERAQAWHRIGCCLYKQDRKDEALHSFRQALREPDITPSLIADIACVFNCYHLIDDERQILQDALKRFPGQVELLAQLAVAESRANNLVEALQILEGIDLGSQDQEFSARVLNDKGHVLDKMGRFDEAYRAFVASAEKRIKVFESKGIFKRKDALVEYSNLLDGAAHAGPVEYVDSVQPLRAPVFMVGFPRSGTTLVERILDCHSEITALPEPDTIAAIELMLDNKFGNFAQILPKLQTTDLEQASNLYWQRAAKSAVFSDSQLIVDKQPNNSISAPLIHRLFPNTKFLMCMRNPLDACFSAFIQNFNPNRETRHYLTLEGAINRFVQIQEYWDKVVERLQLRTHVLVYERLLEDFEGEVRKVCEFLELEYQPQMAEFHEDSKRKRILTPSYQQVINPIYKTSANRYRNYLEQIEPFLPRLQPYLERYGYSL